MGEVVGRPVVDRPVGPHEGRRPGPEELRRPAPDVRQGEGTAPDLAGVEEDERAGQAQVADHPAQILGRQFLTILQQHCRAVGIGRPEAAVSGEMPAIILPTGQCRSQFQKRRRDALNLSASAGQREDVLALARRQGEAGIAGEDQSHVPRAPGRA